MEHLRRSAGPIVKLVIGYYSFPKTHVMQLGNLVGKVITSLGCVINKP